jgi:hypothetical protein
MADHGTFRETELRSKHGDVTHAMLLLMDGVPSCRAVLSMVGAGMQCHHLCPCMALDCAAYGSMIRGVRSARRDLLEQISGRVCNSTQREEGADIGQ